jgi:hypothetical protein
MYVIEIASQSGKPLRYQYLVGSYTVGIITPSRKKHVFRIGTVTGRPFNDRLAGNDGTANCRLSPEEVAEFVITRRLL